LPADAGSINLEKGEYKFNTVRTIHAKPNEGWLFDHWEGIISGLSNPTDIIFYGDHDIRAVFVKDTFRVRTLAGGKGKGFNLDQFNYPTGIAYDQDENLYVSDMHNHRIQKWIKGATFGITIAGGNDYGSDANQLNEPGKIAIDALGTIYVADSENNRIQKWYKGAKEGETVAGGNGRGDGLNQFDKPYGIALDNDGILYVSDIENHRVVRWDPNAKEGVVVAGGNGNGNELNQLSYPMGIILDEKKNLYVADTYNHRVQLWNPGAKEGVTILSADDINFKSFNFFTGITIDKKNRLYLSDYEKRQVVEFDMASESIKIVAGGNKVGPGPNQFSDPFQIVSKTDDFILVADAKNNRIQKWRLN
jgi:sugar lactone lactonase YvrE